MNTELICSGGLLNAESSEAGVLVWKLDESILKSEQIPQKKGLPTKRMKTGQAQSIVPTAKINCAGGLSSIKWTSPNRIVAGCKDHTLKLINVERQQTEEVIFTEHKVPTSIDSSKESILLTGHEDSLIRLWDSRSGTSERSFKSLYESHSKWISSVQFNSSVDNIFISSSFDGTVKLWDLRNEESPLSTLKRKDASLSEDYKVFDIEWNGPSQIISGGSDSHVSIHTLQ